jgi:hypothetical protein
MIDLLDQYVSASVFGLARSQGRTVIHHLETVSAG